MKTSNTPIATAFSIRLPDPTRYDDMEYICEGVIERLQDSAWDMVYKNLQSLAAAPDNVREALDDYIWQVSDIDCGKLDRALRDAFARDVLEVIAPKAPIHDIPQIDWRVHLDTIVIAVPETLLPHIHPVIRVALDECETPVNPALPIIGISDLAALAFATTYPRPGSPCSLLGLAEYLEWDMQPYPATFSYAARLAFEGDHLNPAINDWLEDVITDDLIFSVNTNPDALNQYWDTLEKAAASPAD